MSTPPRIAIIFIGTSVYLHFLRRFVSSVKASFCLGAERQFFAFTENHTRFKDDALHLVRIPFENKRDVKLHKFHLIDSIAAELASFDFVFYFDADCFLKREVTLAQVQSWLDGKRFVAVMHPWLQIRDKQKRFETAETSAAYVPPEERHLLPYHQSCFWGGRSGDVLAMATAIEAMVDADAATGHVNEHLICDEIYVNRYLLSHAADVFSLGTSYAHPGDEYERITRKEGRPGYRFAGEEIVVHDNAQQTRSWSALAAADDPYFTHGAFAQFYSDDLAAWTALEQYRTHNPSAPVHLVADGGDDLVELAQRFGCGYVYEEVNNRTRRNRNSDTNMYVWLRRIHAACLSTLGGVDWVVLLEPDVECFKAPTELPQYVLAGPSRGPAWTPPLREFFAAKFGRLVRSFGLGCNFTGCGGSIFNRAAFVKCFEATPYDEFVRAAQLDDRILQAEDVTLSFLFQLHGFDTGGWGDFTGWKDPEKTSRAFAHGNKQFYGKCRPALDSASTGSAIE